MSRARQGAAVLIALLGLPVEASTEQIPQRIDPIRLSLTFIQSNPVTTIDVEGRSIQAVVDTGGDGALTLSKEIIDSVGGVRLTETVGSTDPFGRESKRPSFRITAVTMDGQTFRNMAVVQAPIRAAGSGPPVPNAIGRQFLSQYFVVVDYPRASITLSQPTAISMNCGSRRIPMEQTAEADLPVSEFHTTAGRLRLLWDTGATYSALQEVTVEKLQLPTTVHGPNSPKFYQSKVLSAAGQDFGQVEFVVLALKLPGDFEGMLGRNFFDHHVVCLDYKRREIRVRL